MSQHVSKNPARLATRDSGGLARILSDDKHRPIVPLMEYKTGGALHGAPDTYTHPGWLADRSVEWRNLLVKHQFPTHFGVMNNRNESTVRYVIYSYATPLAWLTVARPTTIESEVLTWWMPNVKYSITTTKHQTTVRGALSIIANGADPARFRLVTSLDQARSIAPVSV